MGPASIDRLTTLSTGPPSPICFGLRQPVGTGFSQGKVKATNEYDVANEFNGFFKNWEKLFGIENYKIYITVISPSSLIR